MVLVHVLSFSFIVVRAQLLLYRSPALTFTDSPFCSRNFCGSEHIEPRRSVHFAVRTEFLNVLRINFCLLCDGPNIVKKQKSTKILALYSCAWNRVAQILGST